VPSFPGDFSGEILHSHNYRKPEVFINKTVVVVGAGPSGLDIALDLAGYATKVGILYLRH